MVKHAATHKEAAGGEIICCGALPLNVKKIASLPPDCPASPKTAIRYSAQAGAINLQHFYQAGIL